MIFSPRNDDIFNVIEEEDKLLIQLDSEASRKGQHLMSYRAYQIVDFSSQYGSDDSVSYTAENFLGVPAVYPRVGDHAYSFQLRTYGQWWLNVSSYPKTAVNLPVGFIESQDFIEFYIERCVAPVLLRIYEIYNPGAIVKILCYCYGTERWVIIWEGDPEFINPKQSRCFSVTFEGVNFLSDYYRVEFHHKHLSYFCEFDGLVLYGTDKAPLRFPSYTLPKSKFSFKQMINKDVAMEDEMSVEDCRSHFDILPQEVVHNIMSYLDLKSLCNASKVSRLFKRACYDPMLYKDLNLKLYWHMVNNSALKGLYSRLESLRSLNLSWCGGRNKITPPYFIEFLETKFEHLTILKISSCPFITNNCMKAIGSYCSNLEVLELRGCRARDLTQAGYRHIARLPKLTYLDLYRTEIETPSIVMIIKSCINLAHLLLGSCTNVDSFDEVSRAISENLKYIKTLDFWRGISLTCLGIYELAKNCHSLVELDLGWCSRVDANCGCLRKLIIRNPNLKKLYLSAIRTVSNNDVDTVASHCKKIEQLDILGTSEVNLETFERLLESCSHLKLLDVSYCVNSVKHALPTLQERFPSVEFKCSVPSDINSY